LVNEFVSFGHTVMGTSPNPVVVDNEDIFLFDGKHPDPGHDLALALMGRLSQPIDVVINNAGINAIRKFEDMEVSFLREVMNVNAIAPAMLVHHLLKRDLLGPGSVVCNVISDAAWRPMRHSLAYNMSKAALDMATRQMARELTKPHKMTVFGVRPGKMHGTAMSNYIDQQVCDMRGWTREQAFEYFSNNSVVGEEAFPGDVANLIYVLCTTNLPISGACLDLVG
jgi:NAD(P)-dependent dehydrogenase (short-subunit alcohol dehydrogenase family)